MTKQKRGEAEKVSLICALVPQSAWLDRETGAKCYMVAARAMRIIWVDTPDYWRWIPREDSRFA